MNRFSFLTALALVTGIAFAQAEPGTATDIPQASEVMEVEFEAAGSVDTMLEEFLASKSWTVGINAKKTGEFIVVTGTGVIAAPPTHKNYNSSRMLAYEKAFLDAKANLTEFLARSIATAAEFSTTQHEPEVSSPEEQLASTLAKMPSETICGKVVTLMHKKLDNALAKEGYDVNVERGKVKQEAEAIKEKCDSIIQTASFKKSIADAATSMISGLQTFYTVEATGEIGVVAIWSPALAEMAASMVTGQVVANKSPKKPILQQIPQDAATLLSTFGVQQKINEKGELVLVSFAQSSALTASKQSQKNARKQASTLAAAQIRNFAGEAVATSTNLEEAEQTLEFADGSTPDYSNARAYESFQKTAAAAMEVNGIATIKNWSAKHPISGKVVYGVVSTWSPNVAAKARAMKKQIETSARAGALGQRKISGGAAVSTSSKPTVSQDDYIHSGAEGDEDAF